VEKRIVAQVAKKFVTIYRPNGLLFHFERIHLQATWIQYMSIYSIALRLILMLFLYLCISPPTDLFPSAFTAKIFYVYPPL